MSKIIEVLVMEGIALLMFWFAYLIGVKKKMTLIAGYNEKSAQYVTDKDGLARLIGRLCLLVGLASAVMPIATAIWGATVFGYASCTGAYGGFIVGAVGLTVLQARDYASKPGTSGPA